MWLCPFFGNRGNGGFVTLYHEPHPPTGNNWLMYVCTFAIGHLAIQVVAMKNKAETSVFRPLISPEFVAIDFWPRLQSNYTWPQGHGLRTLEGFRTFAGRWRHIETRDL